LDQQQKPIYRKGLANTRITTTNTREEEWRRANLDTCVNKQSAKGLDKEKEKASNKKYRDSEKGKAYMKEYLKSYVMTDEQKEHKQEYDKKRTLEKFVCGCGGNYSSRNKGRHMKSAKHKQHEAKKQLKI
jgi:hypothetical protein